MISYYEARASAHAASGHVEKRLSTRISRLRLATFVPGAALIVFALARDIPVVPLIAGIILLIVFGILVVWHARVEERAMWCDALYAVNQSSLARWARAWDRLPPAEPPAPAEDGTANRYADL